MGNLISSRAAERRAAFAHQVLRGLFVAGIALLVPCLAFASITSTSGNVLYVDSSSNVQPNLLGNYVSFDVTNDTGSAIGDAWVRTSGFTGSFVSLAPNETGIAHLGPMAAGSTRAVFFYLNVDCSSFSAGQCNVTTSQPFAVGLYSGRPTTNLLQSQSFSVTVSDTIAAQANKVTTVVSSSTNPVLGTLLTVTVTGNTGQIGNGKVFYASPQTFFDFPANSFRLYSTSVTFSGGNTGTYTDQLLIPASAFSSTSATDYSFVATYLVVGTTLTPTAVSPVGFISSGNAIKHTGTTDYASLPPIGTTSNSLTVIKTVNSPNWPTGGTATYTIRLANAASAAAVLDDVVDLLPSAPASVTYVSGTSTFGGNAIADPSISGPSLTWTGTFSVPANGTADLVFQANIPATGGTYTNSAFGHVGSTQIDSTLSTSDDSPATVTLNVGTPDLTITKTHSGSFTQGQTGATYSITVGNSGNGITSGTVSVSDALPSGLTATAISGNGWSCTLGTLSCARSDALGAGASYPAIAVTVNVGNSAPATMTNTATVAGGGESNTANDTANDVTTVTQLPDLTIAKAHSGNFTQGQTGATYSITVSNSGSGVTSGTVTVADILPTGLTAMAINGTGWICTLGTLSCTRNDALNAATSYPAIVVTVNVAGNAPATVTNTATVSGGGETNTANDTASDVATITQLPDLTIAKTHSGNFTQGQAGATYSVTVSNSGNGPTIGTVTVSDALPTGLTATAISGTGWTCTLATLTCTRSDALNAGTSYPAIAVIVNVAGNAPATVTNTATVSGGGETNTANDNASDTTSVAAKVPAATATTLAIEPGNTVNAGTAVTLAATVLHGGTPVSPGMVTFCDVTAATCTGAAILGTAQLTSSGIATISLVLGSGSYEIKAVFAGTADFQPSESPAQTLTVNGNGGYPSTTTIGASGTSSNYTLTGTVATFGKPVPTGTVSFLDISAGNAVLGTAALDATTLGFTAVPANSSTSLNGSPCCVAAGDFNGDGKLDLAVPSGSTNAVNVLLGDGDGTFQSPVGYDTDAGRQAFAIAVGDFNGDGNLDLVITNIGSGLGTISVLLGNGDGTFQPQVVYTVGANPSAVVVDDFNGDGDADVAVVNRDDGTVSVLLGNGDGTFQPQVTYPVGSSPVALVATDFNGDGDADVAVVNRDDGTVSILLGNGDGTLQPQATYPVGNSPAALVASDFNGDGVADLATVNASDSTVSLLLGNGDGTLQSQVTYPAGNTPLVLTAADLDGDGKMDVVAGRSDGTVAVLLGKGDGTLQAAFTFSTAGSVGLAAGDFNGDGLADTVSVGGTSVTVLLSEHTVAATASGVNLSAPGTHDVIASYAGDENHEPSQSAPLALTGPALTATTTALAASPNPVTSGQPVTFTATVTPVPSGTPTGTVSFYDGANLLGTGTVDASGVATLTTSSLSSGTHSITAVYSGNAAFAGSTSSPVTLSVTSSGPASTTTALAASPNPGLAGQQITFTATVAPMPAGTPLGTVSFYDGTTLLGTGSVNSSGVATFSSSALAAGIHTITAVYSGNSAFAGSTSAPVSVAVNSNNASYTVRAAQPSYTVVAGQSVAVAVTVAPNGTPYDNTVTMSATGLPPSAVGTFNPPAVVPGSAGAPTTLTIQTAAQVTSLTTEPSHAFPFAPAIVMAGLCFLAGRRRLFVGALLGVTLAVGVLLASGCNGGFAGKREPQSHTYVITITGTSGSLHPSTTITLVVQ